MLDCKETELVKIVRGQDIELDIFIRYKSTEKPFDLTDASIKAIFLKEDGSKLIKSSGITVISAQGGNLKIRLEDSETSILKTGEEMSFELEITKGTDTVIVQFINQLKIVDRLFS